VREATKRKITRGRKLRIDTTVVETNIHYPTDSTLLQDGVRVITRTIKKAQELLPTLSGSLMRDYSRSVKRQVITILKFSNGKSDEAKRGVKRAYQRLCETTRRAVSAATKVKNTLRQNKSEATEKLVSRNLKQSSHLLSR